MLVKEEDLPLVPCIKFDGKLDDYISIVDLVGLPNLDFLPSIEALALLDRVGRSKSKVFGKSTPLYKLEPQLDIGGEKPSASIGGDSDGATNVVVTSCLSR